MLRVNEIINYIKGLDEMIEDKIIIKNILRSWPSIFDDKILDIEEVKDMNTFILD